MYISPTGAGNRDGSDWANAATLSSLSRMVERAGPGGEVLIRADQGAYTLNNTVTVTKGGTAGQEVTIRGVDVNGQDMKAQLVGTRMDEYTPGGARGYDGITLLQGADHLNLQNLAFEDFRTAIRAGWDLKDIAVTDIYAENVQRFFDNLYNGSSRTATISGLLIEDVEVRGFSKGAIRLQYDTHDVVIRNVVGDSERQDRDNFAMGVHLDGTVHDVLIQNTSMSNAHDTMNAYWNGDGFATERGVYNVRFEGTTASGNTDAGYDLKSSNTILVNALASDNKRNYRIWSDSVTIVDSVSLDPHSRGGSGSQAHFQLSSNAALTLIDSVIVSNSTKTVGFDISDNYSRVTLDNTDLLLAAGGRVQTTAGRGSSLFNADGSRVTAQVWSEEAAASATAQRNAAPPVEPAMMSIASALPAVGEGANAGGGTLSFTVTRTGDASGESAVTYKIQPSGAHGVDATDFVGGLPPSGTIVFAAGEREKTVTLQLRGDLLVEQDETFDVVLSDALNGTVGVGALTMTVLNDDPTPVGISLLTRAEAVDLSAAGTQTVVGANHHEIFFVDSRGSSGNDVIANFGRDDVLLLAKKLQDSNNDGIIEFSSGRLSLDGSGGADKLSLAGVDGLRLLGTTEEGMFAYAQRGVRPKNMVEGTVGNDSLAGDVGDVRTNRFFFDTALDVDLGDDRIGNFGQRDILVTTTRLADVAGVVALGADGLLSLPGGTGKVNDGYFSGEGGTVSIAGATQLEYDGAVSRSGTLYHVYSLFGSSAGTFDF
jgi:hypothetical protein